MTSAKEWTGKWLGKANAYNDNVKQDGADYLDRIARSNSAMSCNGCDIWLCYEVSWLMPSGKPTFKVGVLMISYASMYTVESKSVKLYLNSFNSMVFDSETAFKQQVRHDISSLIGSPVDFELYEPSQITMTVLPGMCIDTVSLPTDSDNQLKTIGSQVVDHDTVYSHLFRSQCPVTKQPDWATIMITYSGHTICRGHLLRYLIRYRDHPAFHEDCITKIYTDIMTHCNPKHLSVYGAFSRRGGISIHPLRCDGEADIPSPYFL